MPANAAGAATGMAPLRTPPVTEPDVANGYASEPPLAPADDGQTGRRRGRGGRRRIPGGKYVTCFQVATNADKRRTHSLYAMHAFAYSIIIVGIVFLVLICTGTFPASVQDQKYLGIFVDGVVKYSLYIFSGVVGVIAVLLAKAHLRSGKGLNLPMAAMVLVELSLLATIGMSIYMMTVGSYYGVWWGWLLAGLMLAQRVLYIVVVFFAHYTLWEASRDETVRQRVESVY